MDFFVFLAGVGVTLYLAVAAAVYLWLWSPHEVFRNRFHREMQRLWVVFFSLIWLPLVFFIAVVSGLVGGWNIVRTFCRGLKDKYKR